MFNAVRVLDDLGPWRLGRRRAYDNASKTVQNNLPYGTEIVLLLHTHVGGTIRLVRVLYVNHSARRRSQYCQCITSHHITS